MVALIRACGWSRLAASGSDRRGGLGRIVRRDVRDQSAGRSIRPFLRQDLCLFRKVPALLVTGHTGSAAGDTEEAAGKQDAKRGNGSLWNLLVVSPDVLVGPRMPNYPLNTGQLSCPLITACLWQEWANRAHLCRNLVSVQQSPWYMYRPLWPGVWHPNKRGLKPA